jgi:DNA-binding MarR family transcriptional regulator
MTTDDAAAVGDVAGDLFALARDEHLPPERRAAAMFHAFDVDRRVVEAATSLTAADLRLLWLLSDGRARTQRDIATELNLEQSTVNRQVNAALRAGHLERVGAESGPAMLSATTEGRRRYEADVEALLDVMGTALGALGPDRQKFLESLATFVVAYREALAEARHR